MQELIENLASLEIFIEKDVSIAPYTTFRIGGKADFLCIVKSVSQLKATILACQTHNVPFKILGGGSNVLVSDEGFRGLIIVNRAKSWEIQKEVVIPTEKKETQHRYKGNEELTPIESSEEKVIIRVDSGMKVGALMNALFQEDISGLELFAGIPATVGGAVYMNMHGGKLFFGDLVVRAQIYSNGEVKDVPRSYFLFDYDYSILHDTKETVLSCDLVLTKGKSQEAKTLAKEWLKQKKIQPQRSAGCLFQNLTKEQQEKLGYPTPSVGYVIDKVLGLKGKVIGGAKISESHAAFIENIGNATAKDVLQLINEIKKQMLLKTGIILQTEIEFIGEKN